MTAIQSACIEALNKKWDKLHIETVNRDIFDTVRWQEHLALDDDQIEVYGMFNTIHANNFKEGKSDRKLSCVPLFMNSTAEYLAIYGMNNLSEFAEVPNMVGDLHYYLERDMGRALPLPIRQVGLLLGDGEVEDGPPPPPKRQKTENSFGLNLNIESLLHGFRSSAVNGCSNAIFGYYRGSSSRPARRLSDKGKAKMQPENDSVDTGVSNWVRKPLMMKHPIPQEPMPVGNGDSREALRQAMACNLKAMLPWVFNPEVEDPEGKELMSVECVMELLGFKF
ncbi:hypothetical protein DCAR_0417201 [Daucus carota subsp. sativus]|uniref:Uncharacterized protein n=1 Tax=Daucus carota subsp. sativus TaxID=79200 RepID=A0A165Y6I1_DAUCS|nr:hypothetical protein DCAR_0417201 [Daucus carota subsp. sativus]